MSHEASLTAPAEDGWGFYGTLKGNEQLSDAQAAQAWAAAFEVFRSAPWQPSDIAIRNFLRGSGGRHLADAMDFYEGTIEERIHQSTGENWVAKDFAALAKRGYDQRLFEDDSAA